MWRYRWAERGGTSDPELVAVVVNAHHQTASETDQGDGRLEGFSVGPQVHDADFGLGRAVGSLDDGLERDALLEKVKVTVCGGDGVEVGVGGGELDSPHLAFATVPLVLLRT